MRLSTSTNIMDKIGKTAGAIPIEECVVRCAKAGYRVLDINFCDMAESGFPLSLEGWESWVHHVGEVANEYGVVFSQSHAPFYNCCDDRVPDREWRDELIRRSIIGSGILRVPWIVMHAGTVRGCCYEPEESKRRNIEYFKPFVDLAKEQNVGIAIENMADFDKARRYTAAVEELIDLVKSFDDPAVGICWDFGHANLTAEDQSSSLRRIGALLKATHVADNHGEWDEHLAPFYGTVPWESLMPVLSEISYAGDLTYEIHRFSAGLPSAVRGSMLEHTVEIGRYLMALASFPVLSSEINNC